jgi:hypothetical protein
MFMGMQREGGYSATVEGYLIVDNRRIPLARTNGSTFVLAEECILTPGTTGELLVVVDNDPNSRQVRLPEGVARGQTVVAYDVEAPF